MRPLASAASVHVPNCWSTEVAATEVCGSGTLDLFTVLHLGTPIPGIDYQAGYLLGSVALVEQVGLRFTGPLIDVDAPCLGLPVEITWLERQGAPVPAFKAAKISWSVINDRVAIVGVGSTVLRGYSGRSSASLVPRSLHSGDP